MSQSRESRVEALAIYLRQRETLDACWPKPTGRQRELLLERAWGGISDLLRDGYRERARDIVRFLDRRVRGVNETEDHLDDAGDDAGGAPAQDP